jgi:hypothetical protein
VVELPALVRMKLQSYRDIDRVHLRDLHSTGLPDAALMRKLPKDLRQRLREIQEAME